MFINEPRLNNSINSNYNNDLIQDEVLEFTPSSAFTNTKLRMLMYRYQFEVLGIVIII